MAEIGTAHQQTAIKRSIHIAGSDFFPRRNTVSNEIHWCYGPRLRPDITYAQYVCGAGPNRNARMALNSNLSTQLEGGTPCPECDQRSPLPTTSAAR